MKHHLITLLLCSSITAYSQVTLRSEKPDLPENVWQLKQFKRTLDLSLRRDAAGNKNMDWARWQEWKKTKAVSNKTSGTTPWENLGPHSTSGRIISFAFHPTDTNIIYAGSASGGLWRTTDYGDTWLPLTDNYPTMGIGAVAVNPQNPASILIATGEGYGFGGEFTSGFGILISHDEGQTWSLTNLTAGLDESFAGMDLIWNSSDTTKVCAATSYGMYYSNDGGKNYTYALDRLPSRVIVDPSNPNRLYLSAQYYTPTFPGGFYRSTNSGLSWMLSGSGLPALNAIGYTSLAVHPVYPNIIFANVSQSTVNGLGPMEGLFKSRDYGVTFEEIITDVDIHCYHPPYTSICQGWFANTISISPTDTNTLFAGGTRLWKSTNGGLNWTPCDLNPAGTNYAVHPDHHQTVFHPTTNAMMDCHDGGISFSYDEGDNWNYIGDGLITHQFYTIAFAETDPEIVIGGTQDVGLFSSVNSLTLGDWESELGGDAFGCAIDHQNKNIWYGTQYLNARRAKSINYGITWSQINSGTGMGDQWRMPLVMDPSNNFSLLTSDDGYIYRTTNGGSNWNAVALFGYIGCFEFDKVFPAMVYACELYGSKVYRSATSGNSWTLLSNMPGTPITDLASDPINSGVVYATIGSFAPGNQLFKSTDAGITWMNISSDLPAVPANTVAVDPRDPLTIYTGTDLGVWVTRNGGVSWSAFNDGIPPVVVGDLHFYQPDTTIRIGTYGRGYWKRDALPFTPPIGVSDPTVEIPPAVYPNPVNAGNNIFLSLFSEGGPADGIQLTVTDATGKTITNRQVSCLPGMNEILIPSPDCPGVYFMEIQSARRRHNFKVVVLN